MNYYFQMSIVPLMFRDWWDEWDRPSRLLDQHFGMGLKRDELLSSLSAVPSSSLFRNSYFRPWRTALTRQESASTINLTKEKFEVSISLILICPLICKDRRLNISYLVKYKTRPKQIAYLEPSQKQRMIMSIYDLYKSILVIIYKVNNSDLFGHHLTIFRDCQNLSRLV